MKITTKVPRFMKDFTCIGSSCTDTCCSGLNVSIDRHTLNKYESIEALNKKEDEWFIERKKNYIQPVSTEHPLPLIHAFIQMDHSGHCPFLTQDRLCHIQKTYGESHLGNACSMFPKVYSLLGVHVEKTATFSCPEVARLALLRKEGIQFDEQVEEVDERFYLRNAVVDTSAGRSAEQARSWIIGMLQNRSYSLSQRLSAVGVFCKHIDDDPEWIDVYTDTLPAADSHLWINQTIAVLTPLWHSVVFPALSSIAHPKWQTTMQHMRVKPIFDSVDPDGLKAFDYILENYLVNYVLLRFFPFGEGQPGLIHLFQTMNIHFHLIQMIALSSCHTDSSTKTLPISEEAWVHLIQSYTKYIERNPSIEESLQSLFSTVSCIHGAEV